MNSSSEPRRNRFDSFTLDELHTLLTALGNAIKHCQEEEEQQRAAKNEGAADYISMCKYDNEYLIREANEALRKKPTEP